MKSFIILTCQMYQGPCPAPSYFKIFTSRWKTARKGGFAHENASNLLKSMIVCRLIDILNFTIIQSSDSGLQSECHQLQEVLISNLPPPSLLFCLSSAVSPAGPTLQERRYYLSHKNFPSRPTWWRLPPPSCWPASPEWASSSWCSPTSGRGSAPCDHQMISNVKRTKCNILTWPDRMD